MTDEVRDCCQTHAPQPLQRMYCCETCHSKRCPHARNCEDLCETVRCYYKRHHQPCDCAGMGGDR